MKNDLVGEKFGRLTVIKDDGTRDKHKHIKWLCECECGNKTHVISPNLKKGYTKSCGCYKSERSKEQLKKANEANKNLIKEGTSIAMLNKKINKNNTSGYKGVYRVKGKEKWRVQIGFKGNLMHVGYFSDKQDAINARKAAEEEYFKPILEKYDKKRLKASTQSVDE